MIEDISYLFIASTTLPRNSPSAMLPHPSARAAKRYPHKLMRDHHFPNELMTICGVISPCSTDPPDPPQLPALSFMNLT